MKSLKILLSLVFAAAITFGGIYPASALPRTINQTSETQNIATGVTLERVRRFTDNGWLNFNVIRADMNNPYVYADTITDSSSIQNLISPLTEARNRNAVAAVNGSFFIWTDVNNKIIPIGPIVGSEGIKTSYMELNNAQSKMATLSINVLNEILCDFWKTEMWLENKNGVTLVSRYNRPYYSYNDLTVIDRKWSSTSAGSTISGSIEMVVVNNTVTEIRKGLPPITIPENGFVVVTRNEGASLLQQKFSIGDKVSFKIITAPVSWENAKMAISGGSLLVSNGKIPYSFSHDSPGANPRTAVGASRDSKELIVVTVDGRQDASLGLTQYELAELMLELGAYNAINLDGGGSTAMAARLPGDLSASLVNIPSDGAVRKVANVLGIFSSAPKGPIARLVIDCEDRNIFSGTSRKFTVKAIDAFLNPVPIDESQVTWGV
ncbi:MAG: phosphodiester glycosidase family protein, partial [Eubacteriales bacterium]|nr:phosphodiester glycosidase family protein [Eubacteriales bacterium]